MQKKTLSFARSAALVFFVICIQTADGGWPIFNYRGQAVAYGDRPLLISTWTNVQRLFSDEQMKKNVSDIGYLDYTAITNTVFQSVRNFSAGERASVRRSKRYLAELTLSEEPLEFNGRVIIMLHGDHAGNIQIEYAGGNVQAGNAYELAVRLFSFFQKYKIKVSHIDLNICSGDSSRIVDLFFQGLESVGASDVEVQGFSSKTGLRWEESHPDKVYFHIDGVETYKLRVFDYYVRDMIFDTPEIRPFIIRKRLGSPPDRVAPEVSKTGKCSQSQLLSY